MQRQLGRPFMKYRTSFILAEGTRALFIQCLGDEDEEKFDWYSPNTDIATLGDIYWRYQLLH